jgi:phytanoyl-CoA hydroxylase
MLTAAQVAQFDRDGFIKGGKVLNDEQVEKLRAETLRVIEQRENKEIPQPVMCHNMGKPQAPVWQIVNIWQASEPFSKLIFHPTIIEEIAQLTRAKQLKIWHDQIQFKPAGTGGVNMWHQDAPYWPILTHPTEVTAWIALDDVDAENGCMSMVPGSHKWGNAIDFIHTIKSFTEMPGEFRGQKLEVKLCPVKKGEVHFHHALTWHGSQANTSARPRRAIALHYMTEETTLGPKGEHVMKPFIKSGVGEPIEGPAFPVVWQK